MQLEAKAGGHRYNRYALWSMYLMEGRGGGGVFLNVQGWRRRVKKYLKVITCARSNRFKKCVAIKIAVLKKIVTGSQYQPDSDEDNSGTVD